MLRYRYANASPKRQDWEDAHGWRKVDIRWRSDGFAVANRHRPHKRRQHHVVASVTWTDPESNATLGADLYCGRFVKHTPHLLDGADLGAKSVSFWKASIAAMVEADKEAGGKWAPKKSVALPGDKYLAAERRRFNAMVGPYDKWWAYVESHPEEERWMPRTTKRGRQLARRGPYPQAKH